MKTDSELIADRLTKIIKSKDITINRLATLSALGQSSVNAIFRGDSASPKLKTLVKIANGLDMSLTELLDFPPYNQRPDGSSPDQETDRWNELGQALTADEKKRVWETLTGHDFPPYNEVEK